MLHINPGPGDNALKRLINVSLRAPERREAIPIGRRDCFVSLAMTIFIAGFG